MEILLANPRGFCAGVDRAIEIVNRALDMFGAPIYVKHEVVHNRYVVDGLKAKGATQIVIHHNNKPDKDGYTDWRGSAAIGDACDCIYMLKAVENEETIDIRLMPRKYTGMALLRVAKVRLDKIIGH